MVVITVKTPAPQAEAKNLQGIYLCHSRIFFFFLARCMHMHARITSWCHIMVRWSLVSLVLIVVWHNTEHVICNFNSGATLVICFYLFQNKRARHLRLREGPGGRRFLTLRRDSKPWFIRITKKWTAYLMVLKLAPRLVYPQLFYTISKNNNNNFIDPFDIIIFYLLF